MRRALVVVALLVLTAGCAGGSPTSSARSTLAAGQTPNPSVATTAKPSSAATPGQPAFSFGTGATVTDLAHAADLLAPADFAAVGLAGARTPTSNPSGNANYVVYAGTSAAGGGLELDIFMLDTPAEAVTDFGGVGLYALDDAVVQEIGADNAGYYSDQPGNDPGTTFSEIRVLKGNGWFDIGVPSGPNDEAQLLALTQLVLARGAALFG